ncbi:PDZ domain-containing protein [Amnibacterium flavum]|uniref:endopeptidase La n=2 Tax=Amnibacterium flavum TaxID=2173173 RepID=A0A2V1HWI7_9MICO|nr:ATP-dependent serine peptidase containing a PDZ domain protein [Amnibacterium flavum]
MTDRERRTWLGWLLIGVALVIVIALAFAPSPYVIETPGPVYNTLGTVGEDDAPLISIPDEETYETDGSLDLLTVSVLGSPSGPANFFEVAMSWFDPSRSVQPLESVFPAGTTTDDQREQSAIQMTNSQQEAIAAALTELGYEFSTTVSIGALLDDSPAQGILEEGDVITSVDGVAVTGLTDLREKLAAHGADSPAQLGIERDGSPLEVEVTPTERDGAVVLGVGVEVSYDFPFDVSIELPNVGGPSAGMMFALGIYDKLTPDALTGGLTVAGTGTIDAAGTVGPIGGIRQKLYGAQQAGATLFLAPASNCDEVVGHVPGDLQVVAVETLEDAITAIETVSAGDDTSDLPTCEAAAAASAR